MVAFLPLLVAPLLCIESNETILFEMADLRYVKLAGR